MRTQPQTIITQLEADNSRLAKEAILAQAVHDGLDEFFQGVRMALDKLYTFGVKNVPVKTADDGQGLPWAAFVELATQLNQRKLTGHAARDAIELAMDVATQDQWNDWYRRILIKDLRCGVSEKTVNKVAKKAKRNDYAVPVFTCALAEDSAKHEKKLAGPKLLEVKLDGVRCLTVIDKEAGTVTQYTRNGNLLENFGHITDRIAQIADQFETSTVLDGEVMSSNFQALMTQVHRKTNVQSSDAQLFVFDVIPLAEFLKGKGTLTQAQRSVQLGDLDSRLFDGLECVQVVKQHLVDLDTVDGQRAFAEYNRKAIESGFEGVMIKDPNAVYECKRSTSWLKAKPFIEVTLEVIELEEGTGRNEGRLGAFVCSGVDDGKDIRVNVGSGFTDGNRDEYWTHRDSIKGQLVEVRADAITQNQDGTYSLRFPRFKTFRGFVPGQKI